MTNFKATMIGLAAAAAMVGTQALAAEGSLAPGKPAGIKEAARHSPNLLLIGGAAAIAVVGIVVAVQSSDNAACGSACTVTTATTTTS
jgi:spore maturation protein SpmA